MTPDEQYHQDTTEHQRELDEQAEYEEEAQKCFAEWDERINKGWELEQARTVD